MLERLPYFRCRPADYLLDTLGLRQNEHGAYWLLMAHYYWNGFLPSIRDELYALACATTEDEKRSTDKVLGRFFHDDKGIVVHHRIERELESLKSFFRSQSTKGKASAQARAKKPRAPRAAHEGNGADVSLPMWIDVECWKVWISVRPARANKPNALVAAISQLTKMRAAGHDPNDILRTSAANGWTGLFAPKGAAQKIDPRNPGPGKAVM